MVLFQSHSDPKYQLLDNPSKHKCKCAAHSWAVFGLIVLSVSITVISLIIIWDQIKQMQHKTETLDYVLFGPKRKVSDMTRFSEYRALAYALANASFTNDENNNLKHYVSNDGVETYQHVDKTYSLVCYYSTPLRSSSQDRLYPEYIDPDLCTHLIIAFATVHDNCIDFTETEIFTEIQSLKKSNPNLKILLSVLSFSSTFNSFSVMVSSKENRKTFIDDAIIFLKTNSLDGIDLDWEFPSWPLKDSSEKDLFTELLKEMRITFDNHYMITVAVAAPYVIVEKSYNVPEIAKYVDFVNVMCYDYHYFVWYYPLIGPNAPLYPNSNDTGYISTLNINFTIHYWLKNGMPKNKIVLGMPLYGHSWTLFKPNLHEFGAPATGFGSIGEKGFVSYREVCAFINSSDTTVEFNGETRVPYAYQDKEWFSYDNQQSLAYKAEFVTELGLKGGMVFSLNYDDFEGKLCSGNIRFPLTKRIKKVLMDDDL